MVEAEQVLAPESVAEVVAMEMAMETGVEMETETEMETEGTVVVATGALAMVQE